VKTCGRRSRIALPPPPPCGSSVFSSRSGRMCADERADTSRGAVHSARERAVAALGCGNRAVERTCRLRVDASHSQSMRGLPMRISTGLQPPVCSRAACSRPHRREGRGVSSDHDLARLDAHGGSDRASGRDPESPGPRGGAVGVVLVWQSEAKAATRSPRRTSRRCRRGLLCKRWTPSKKLVTRRRVISGSWAETSAVDEPGQRTEPWPVSLIRAI